LEVAQIGRTIARALGLNEDLTEALCLAHDFGHPPFGHAGEDALDAVLLDAGGFDHNAHTIRIVTKLENPYPDFDGLNLSWEALEGLAKHNGPIVNATWAMTEANDRWDLQLDSWPSLEAQIAAVADDIAYDNHDIDDVRGAGLALAGFSPALADDERDLKLFLYERLYDLPALKPIRVEAERIVSNLAAAYRSEPNLLPAGWQATPDPLRTIGDFI